MHKINIHPYADLTQIIPLNMLLSNFSIFLTYADEG